MREYIMRFKQKFLIEKNIDTREVFLIDYMVNFFSSGKAVSKEIDGKTYFWLTYEKVLKDMPVLNVQKRQLQRMMADLEQKGVIRRYTDDCQMYIAFCAFWEMYDRFDIPYSQSEVENDKIISKMIDDYDNSDRGVCQNCPQIISYNNNKINIFFYNPNQIKINGNDFCFRFLQLMKEEVSEVLFYICFDRTDVQKTTKNLVSLWVDNDQIISKQKLLAQRVEKVAKLVLDEMLERTECA